MLLDIGVGIILGTIFDSITETHSLLTLVGFGIFAALSPDLDFLFHLLKGGNSHNDQRHREVLHKPYFLFLGWLVIALLTSPILAWLFVAGALSHFIHDSIGIGWGVQWLAPFKTDHFTFLYRVHTTQKPKPPRRNIYVWPNSQIDELNQRYGDEEWFRNTYLKWHPFAVFELMVFVMSCVILYIYTR